MKIFLTVEWGKQYALVSIVARDKFKIPPLKCPVKRAAVGKIQTWTNKNGLLLPRDIFSKIKKTHGERFYCKNVFFEQNE